MAHALAAREAHRPDDIEDLVQVATFAYHRTAERYTKDDIPVEKPLAFAQTLLVRSMRGYYFQQREWQQRGELNKAVEIGDNLALFAGLTGAAENEEQAELFELDDFFAALERACGPTARIMVENLVLPSGRCCAAILAEVQRKQHAQAGFAKKSTAARRHQPRGVKKGIRISPRMVRDALGLSVQEWSRTMRRIQEFALAYGIRPTSHTVFAEQLAH